MKKIIAILLGLCFVIPAVMAAEVSDINKRAWLSHIKEMNVMRRQIIELNNKENKTAEDLAAYNDLMAKFDAKQAAWDEYIAAVANDDEEGRAKVENKFQGERHHPRFHKGHKCHKEEKCGECPKAQKCEKPCCKKAEKCEKKCMKADKCGKCPKAEKCEKKCVKEEKCGECPKSHKHPKDFKKLCECCKCAKCGCIDCDCCKCEKCDCRKAHKCHKSEKCGDCREHRNPNRGNG